MATYLNRRSAMARSLVPEAVEQYIAQVTTRETPVQQKLRAETSKMAEAGMQIGADQGAFFALLIRAIGARKAIEIGTFTGYSALAVASALPEGGKLVACDVSEEWTAIGKRHWQEAGVAEKIDLRLGPATETLAKLLDTDGASSYDFAFIDADKPAYDKYYELLLQLLRPGGLIALDNTLWSGHVANPDDRDPNTVALRALNDKLHRDERIDVSLLPVGDGLTLARKK
jgi:caffeoyl-CoA O-methyltransferase